MTEKKIIKASDLKKTAKKSESKGKIDLSKIKDIIDDNPEAVKKIKDGVTDIIKNNVLGSSSKKTTSKKTTKKSSSKTSNSDSLSKVMDLASTFLKK